MHLHIIEWSVARDHGLKRYFTGKPCKYNQLSERLTSTRACQCFICQAKHHDARKETRKKYGEKNREGLNKKINDKRIADRRKPHNPTFVKV